MLSTYLLEDNAAELANVREFLAQRCPQVEVVGAAGEMEEAFDGISLTRPDLLISDINIIGGRCYALLDRLNDAGQLAGLRIVFMTLFRDFDLVREELAHAPVDFLEKPFTADDLQRAVEKVAQIPVTPQTHRQVERLLELLSGEGIPPPLPLLLGNPLPEARTARSLREILRRWFRRRA